MPGLSTSRSRRALVAPGMLAIIVAAMLFGGALPSATPVALAAHLVPVARSVPADFLAAAALLPADVPAGLQFARQGTVTADQVAAQDAQVAAVLSDNGFVVAAEQAFPNRNLTSTLLGAAAGAGAVTVVFGSVDGAATWNDFEIENAAAAVQQIATAGGVAFTVSQSVAIDIGVLGDDVTALELSGSATIGGITAPLYVDAAFIRRGSVQYTVVVAGLRRQQPALTALAQALDARVAAALPLLRNGGQ